LGSITSSRRMGFSYLFLVKEDLDFIQHQR
jgi:hypothetical protein